MDVLSGHETIQLQTSQLESLPTTIDNLETTIQFLRDSQPTPPTDKSLSLPLPATLSLLSNRESELAELNAEVRSLENAISRKTSQLEKLSNELKPLEVQKKGVTAAATEARRRREEALTGHGDDLEDRGRWWRAVDAGLKGMLEVQN